MVDHQEIQYYEIGEPEDLPPGERLFIEIDGAPIVVFNIAGDYFAIGDICTHDNAPLGDGELDGFALVCPRHGARFDVRSGEALTLPAVKSAPAYTVRVEGGKLELGLPVE